MAGLKTILENAGNILAGLETILRESVQSHSGDPLSSCVEELTEQDFPSLRKKIAQASSGERADDKSSSSEPPAEKPVEPAQVKNPEPAKTASEAPSTRGRASYLQVFSDNTIVEELNAQAQGEKEEARKRLLALRDELLAGEDAIEGAQAEALAKTFITAKDAGFDALAGGLASKLEKERISFFPDDNIPYNQYPAEDVEVKKEFAEGVPAGQLVRIERPGITKGVECLLKARVVVSKGVLTEEAKLLENLKDIEGYIESNNLVVDQKLTSFLAKAPKIMESLSQDEQKGDTGHKILVDTLGFLEKLKSQGEDDGLSGAVGRIIIRFTNFLKEKDFEFFPEGDDPGNLDDKDLYEIRKDFSDREEGSYLRTEKQGIRYKGRVIQKAKIVVSAGAPPEAWILMREAISAIKKAGTLEPEIRPRASKAIKSIREWLEMIPQKSEETHPDFVRYALSLIDDLNDNGALNSFASKLLGYLKKNGYTEIRVVVGDTFDESYSPSKYERKKLSSSEPTGKIIKLIRRGFVDKNGVTIQKAVVGISG